MQYEYMVRRLDTVGRLNIPMKMLKELRLDGKGHEVEIFVDGDNVVIEKWNGRRCIFCKGIHEVAEFKGKFICQSCKEHLLTTDWEAIY